METVFLDIQNFHNKSDFINEEVEDMYEEITREYFQKLINCKKRLQKEPEITYRSLQCDMLFEGNIIKEQLDIFYLYDLE